MYDNYEVTWLTFPKCFFSKADITPEEIFNMFFGGFGGGSMSGGKEMRLQEIIAITCTFVQNLPAMQRDCKTLPKITDNKVVSFSFV